jgi:hypothetical protein
VSRADYPSGSFQGTGTAKNESAPFSGYFSRKNAFSGRVYGLLTGTRR